MPDYDYGFTTDARMVRVDIWKQSGKWYTTLAMKWLRYVNRPGDDIHSIFRESFITDFNDSFKGMRVTCLEPYHEHSHPISINIPE